MAWSLRQTNKSGEANASTSASSHAKSGLATSFASFLSLLVWYSRCALAPNLSSASSSASAAAMV